MADLPSLLPLLLTVLTISNSLINSASAQVQPLLPSSLLHLKRPLSPPLSPPLPPSLQPPPAPPSSLSPPPPTLLLPTPPPLSFLSPPPPHPPSPSPPPQHHLSRPPAPPLPLPPPPPSLPAQPHNNIIDALIGAADFNDWANIVSIITPLTFSVSATLFVPPSDPVNRKASMDPFLLPYHIVPQRLSFSDLQLFGTNNRLPTLLPRRSILITNSAASNFTLDDVHITQPDVYSNDVVVIHGISAVLNYTIYGDGVSQPPAPRPKETTSAPEPDDQGTLFVPNTATLAIDFPSLFLIVAALLAL